MLCKLGSITSKYYKLDGLDHRTFKAMFDAVVYPVMSYAAAAWGYTYTVNVIPFRTEQ